MAKRSSRQHLIRLAALAVLAALGTQAAHAQVDAPTEFFQINAHTAQTFHDGNAQIVQIDGPVTITTDRAKLSAKSAVIWFSRVEGSVLGRQRAEVALLGDASIEQGAIQRSGDKLFVSTVVGGPIRLTVEERITADVRQSDLYRRASDIRPLTPRAGAVSADNVLIQRPWIDPPATGPSLTPDRTVVRPKTSVTFSAADVQHSTATPDGTIAVILKGGVVLLQRTPNGDLLELLSDSAVLFTTLKDFNEVQDNRNLQSAITAAYLEGDVRIVYTPATNARGAMGEQRLRAERAYYEFGTDRAVLTDVVLQSTDPRVPFPITMRASTVKQLAQGEYKGENVTLTTSQFATPSYSVNASKAYVRQYEGGEQYGTRTQFKSENTTFRAADVPVFWLPGAGGELTERGFPLRGLGFSGRRNFGFGLETEWGLFESLGQMPPEGLDASYRLDYYADRGPGIGFDARYKGGFITETTKEGWNFNGDLTSYLVYDQGQDRLGRERLRLPTNDDAEYDGDFRGRILWEHQHFLPDDWQIQLRAGYTSDATFLEEWFEKDFDNGLPTNLSAYAKRQRNTEALTFLLEYQPNEVVTTAGALQERFVSDRSTFGSFDDRPFEIDRLPEVGYFRVGDSLAGDRLTFFSENRIGGYHMNASGETLRDYGFHVNNNRERYAVPGLPSYGYTGTTNNYVIRGDFRQEIDWPIDAGEFKIVPYVVGRYTGYSDSPDDDPQNRLLVGAGTRITTAFWKIDDSAHSRLFDIHRIRHVIEPELNLFTSVSTLERDEVFIYDETIDGINDISAASFFIRQRWQTKRGGPGRERSVDVFALNVGVIGFANEPDEVINPDRAYFRGTAAGATFEDELGPTTAKGFRGLYYQSMPEASIPRSSVQGDALWRISDTTILLGDASWNIREQELSTAALGLLVGRGERVTYFTGIRYIGELDSTIASFSANYQLTAKYSANFAASIDLSRTQSKGGSFSIIRRFDRFFVGVGAFYDAVEDEGGLTVAIYPEGLGSPQISGNAIRSLAR